jgi:hypothetical protein
VVNLKISFSQSNKLCYVLQLNIFYNFLNKLFELGIFVFIIAHFFTELIQVMLTAEVANNCRESV